MKNFKHILYIGAALTAMSACSDNGMGEPATHDGKIQLGVSVGDIQAGSRTAADPFLGMMPSPEKPLKTAVWFRTENDNAYKDSPSGETSLPAHTRVTFKGAQLEYVYRDAANLLYPLKYPTDFTKVYCVGLYPDDEEWATSDNITVSHPIDGNKDLMLAKQTAGTWDEPFAPLRYEHLLTWIKINICASSHDAVDAWGTIRQIYITSDSGVKINLTGGGCEYVNPSGTSIRIPTMNESEPIILSTATQEVGSVLCSPEKEYTVTVESVNKSGITETRTVPMKLNLINEEDETFADIENEEQARGKCFVFSLYFTPYKVIEGVCTLNAWNNQNEDIYLQ